MQEDFSHCPCNHIVTLWDKGANSLELEGKEAKELEFLSTEGGTDEVTGKVALAFSLWR